MQSTRLAMWSGPRNISTAMMRSFENRRDCEVIDEPFYAYYLTNSGEVHPMQEEILASQSSVAEEVISLLTETKLAVKYQYQKHMTHHMLPGMDFSWVKGFKNCFLIRNPKHIILSYTDKMSRCRVDDIGIIRQAELYKMFCEIQGKSIPIVDSDWVLQNPKHAFETLCAALEIPFDEAMLSWPAGKRESDGVWAAHWYQNVEASTGFKVKQEKEDVALNKEQQAVYEQVKPAFEFMYQQRLT